MEQLGLGVIRQPVPPAAGVELRDYQLDAIAQLRELVRAGHRRIVLQAGTGSGKTVIAAEIIRGNQAKAKRSLFLAHRRELIHQCSDKLAQFGVAHGILMAGEPRDIYAPCQVASKDTLYHRGVRTDKIDLPRADLVVLDECHRSLSPTWLELVEAYPDAVVLGLSATPARAGGKGLGFLYQDMVCCPPVQDLIDDGYLVPPRYYAPTIPDLRQVHVRQGEYVQSELEQQMDKVLLVGDVVDNWLRIAPERKTVGFATSVRHSIAMAEAFNAAGVRAAHIDGSTPKDERDDTLADPDIRVLWNCDVLTEGWDQPEVSCCILAKPTKSFTRYMQMVGRILRPFPGKVDAVVIDHAGAVHEHGFVEEPVEWNLTVAEPAAKRPVQQRREDAGAEPLVCKQCLATYVGRGDCPECGWRPELGGRQVRYIDADLGLVTKPQRHAQDGARPQHTEAEKQRWWRMMLGFAAERGFKRGWAYHKFREKFNTSPRSEWGDRPVEPDPVVRNWCVSRLIAYRQAMQRKGG